MEVRERTVEGLSGRVLAGPGLEATFVPSAGMVGCSLRHHGEELLGQRRGLRAYASEGGTMGIPLLYPWANRLARTRYSAAGREVALDADSPRLELDPNGLPIHGLLAAAPGWQVERHEASDDVAVLAAGFDFAAHPDLLAAFPFPHQVFFEARLAADRLTVTTTVTASDVEVPVSFGYHPYLRLPDVERADWRVEIPVRERLELDDLMLPTGQREPVDIESGALGVRTFDDGYLAPVGGESFVLAGGNRRIDLLFEEGYPFAQVYAPDDDDVIAYEPMTAPTNALVSGTGLSVVRPGDQYRARFSIAVVEEGRLSDG